MENKTTIHENWQGIYALTLLNISIAISWLAYNNYQLEIIKQFQLESLTFIILIGKALILVILPIIVGYYADKIISSNGNQFVLITIGISITAMIFMIVSSILQIGPTPLLKIILPIMIILWLISMNIYHAPAQSLLDQLISKKNMPLAMAIISFFIEIVNGIEPILINIMNYIGTPITFSLGGILLIISGYWFLKISKKQKNETPEIQTNNKKSSFIFIIVIALILGGVSSFIIDILPIYVLNLDNITLIKLNSKEFASATLLLAAFFTLPIGFLIKETQLKKYLILGISLSFLAILSFIILPQNNYLIFLNLSLLSLGFSLQIITAFPLTLDKLNYKQLTIGTGIFYGISELIPELIDIIF